jgi:hypothetical protein
MEDPDVRDLLIGNTIWRLIAELSFHLACAITMFVGGYMKFSFERGLSIAVWYFLLAAVWSSRKLVPSIDAVLPVTIFFFTAEMAHTFGGDPHHQN